MERFICIHGHFYQPPRENPWLEVVEFQDSAAPYHDWNERITAECYAPNARARILNGEQKITDIVSNYSKISFNFGPTLLAWMHDQIPEIHDAIIQADKQSLKNFSGHGSAMAQVYNHMILPLANDRDKRTQVLWGIRDFEFRFGRKPEGMWLSETAADTETLEVLADYGIKFTVLSPFQASKVRDIGNEEWHDVNGGHVDPKVPYLMNLPSGKKIAVFFYDGPISKSIAFEGLLDNGEKLANRLAGAFVNDSNEDQLVHIATDGESYGHHHRHGEMALSYALHHLEQNKIARLTNYSEYLETHPPKREAQIHEKSAWSCSHGVGRWKEDCGCNSGGHGGWNQGWRAPLRFALDWLRDEVAPLYEAKCRELLQDPWKARDDYISIILDRSTKTVDEFFGRHAVRDLSETEKVTALKLLELQRHAMLMYTSCGWFFDELSGIETVQVIQYAGRVLQLVRHALGRDLEPTFLEKLENAKSNILEHRDGRVIYNKFVKPAMVDWDRAVAHYAISSIFQRYSDKTRLFIYTFQDEDRQEWVAGKSKLAIGRTRVTFDTTRESAVVSYAALYLGEHNLTAGVRSFYSGEDYNKMKQELKVAFDEVDFPQTIRLIDRHFGNSNYSLKSLFKDEQREILEQILESTREDLESRYRRVVERYTPLMKFLGEVGKSLLPSLEMATKYIQRIDLRRQFEAPRIQVDRVKTMVEEAKSIPAEIFNPDLSFAIKKRMETTIQHIAANPTDTTRIKRLTEIADIVMPLPLGLNLWKVQNTYWEMLNTTFNEFKAKAAGGDKRAQTWVEQFLDLGDRMQFAVQNYR